MNIVPQWQEVPHFSNDRKRFVLRFGEQAEGSKLGVAKFELWLVETLPDSKNPDVAWYWWLLSVEMDHGLVDGRLTEMHPENAKQDAIHAAQEAVGGIWNALRRAEQELTG